MSNEMDLREGIAYYERWPPEHPNYASFQEQLKSYRQRLAALQKAGVRDESQLPNGGQQNETASAPSNLVQSQRSEPPVASVANPSPLDQFGGSAKLLIASGISAAAIGGTVGTVALIRSRKKPKRRTTRSTSSSRKSSQRSKQRKTAKKKFGSAREYARPGGKKVYRTKNGQPYILLRSGKARFIKKRGR